MATVDIHRSETAGEKLLRFALNAGTRTVAILRAYRNRRAMMDLARLDPRMLHDIGITQHDVRAALAAPMSDDPSARLSVLANERRTARLAQARERAREIADSRVD